MNWLIWIGGGYLFLAFGYSFFRGARKETENASIIALVIAWIWICWKFIR